jgi:tetratricopeptide (TPR) repeat protein
MTFRKASTCTILFCIVTFGTTLWAGGVPASGPCPSNPEISKALDAGKYSGASEMLQKMLSRNPNDVQTSLWITLCFLDLGNIDQAVNYAQRAVKQAPDCSDSHLWLGRAYGLKAEKSRSLILARKSREEFLAAVRLNPDNLLARRDLMDFYLQAPWFLGGSKDKAWAQAEAIASRNAIEGYLAHADYWRENNDPTRAAQAYQEVLKLRPQRVGAYFQIADFYEANRDGRQLETVVQAASLVEPNDPRLAYYRGVARVLEGRQLPEAEQYFKEYLARAPQRDDFPPHAAAHDYLARIYERSGKRQEAVQQYKAALHLSPDNQTAQEGLKRLESN